MKDYAVFCATEIGFKTSVVRVKAKNAMHSFYMHASKNENQQHEYFFSMPYKDWERIKDKVEFAGESLVSTETVLDQPEVFSGSIGKLKKKRRKKWAIRTVYYCSICGWESFSKDDDGAECGKLGCPGHLDCKRKETYEV